MNSEATCVECERVFDLTVPTEAAEWFYGHDCEVAEIDPTYPIFWENR